MQQTEEQDGVFGIFRGCPVLFYFFFGRFCACVRPRCDTFLETSQGGSNESDPAHDWSGIFYAQKKSLK
jgi:hypothetical protein